jgi:hypothetical protein
LVSGIWDRSKTVPTVAENGLRQNFSRHFQTPGRVLLPCNRVALPITPQ